MIIAIDVYTFYGLIGVSIISIIALIGLYFAVKKNAPDAMEHWKAKRKGLPICRVHYRGKRAVDYIAHIDELEKDIGTPYWTVPDVGLKFKPSADDIETIEGSIACANYYTNLTESMSIAQVVAYSQLKDWFGKQKMPIDTIEGIAFYVAQDFVKTGSKERAIANARIESKETKAYLMRYLDLITAQRKELDRMKLESGVFTFQTAMKALDQVEGTTSAHVEHLKKVVRAAALRELEDKNKRMHDLMTYAVVAFILVIAVIALYIGLRK